MCIYIGIMEEKIDEFRLNSRQNQTPPFIQNAQKKTRQSWIFSLVRSFFGRSDRVGAANSLEPALALPSRMVVSPPWLGQGADTPCFVGKNFEKTPHRGVFLRFLLVPNGNGGGLWGVDGGFMGLFGEKSKGSLFILCSVLPCEIILSARYLHVG